MIKNGNAKKFFVNTYLSIMHVLRNNYFTANKNNFFYVQILPSNVISCTKYALSTIVVILKFLLNCTITKLTDTPNYLVKGCTMLYLS